MWKYSFVVIGLNTPDEPISENEVSLLGLIAEEPIHAYGLQEKIQERSMEDWTTLSRSSIYRVLQNLEDRGFVTARLEHEGQGATRKVFEITADGLDALAKGVLGLLANTEQSVQPFLVGLGYSFFAARDEVVRVLRDRRTKFHAAQKTLAAARAEAMAQIHRNTEARQVGAECTYDLFFDYLLERAALEIRFLERAAEALAEAPQGQKRAPNGDPPG